MGVLIATMRDRGIIMSTVARYFAVDHFLLVYLILERPTRMDERLTSESLT